MNTFCRSVLKYILQLTINTEWEKIKRKRNKRFLKYMIPIVILNEINTLDFIPSITVGLYEKVHVLYLTKRPETGSEK